MTTKSHVKPLLTSATLAGALVVAAAAAAAGPQHLAKEGAFAYRACYSGTSKAVVLSKSQVAFSVDLTGENVADTPGTFLDHASFRCEGIGTRFGKERTDKTACLFVDQDGDKALALVTMRNGKWHRQDIGGTGKYDGMVVHADVESMGRFPTMQPGTFQGCNHVAGTYKLK